MFLIDSHCHLDSLDYSNRTLNEVMSEAYLRDVKYCLSVAITLSGYQTMRKLVEHHLNTIFLSCGVHPLNLDEESFDLTRFKQLASDQHVVALGETGLDYYYRQDNMKQQQEIFAQHIWLGRELQKPVIVHTREAKQDTLNMIKSENAYSGVLHCFTEDIDTARTLLDLGFYISFSGIITFNNAESLREVARYVPIDRLLIETDSPYLAPVPYRGKENQPANVKEVAEYLALLKQVSLDVIAEQTTQNFCHLFGTRLC